jgi:pimeloyl-ACP methyl ester carboxylesterase
MSDEQFDHRKTNVFGHSIHYLVCGEVDSSQSDPKETLILLHGIGASAERWLKVIPILSKNFKIIVPDIIGFGYSEKPILEYTIDYFVKFLHEFLSVLKIDKASLMGSSFGGLVITEFAIRFPNLINKIVLVSPAGIMRTSTRLLDEYILAALYPTYENVERAFKHMTYDQTTVTEEMLHDFMKRMTLPNAKYTFMSTLLGIKNAPNIENRLNEINLPTLVLWGEYDMMIPPSFAEAYRKIKRCTIIIIPRAGHTPFTECPQNFCNHVLNFLHRQ